MSRDIAMPQDSKSHSKLEPISNHELGTVTSISLTGSSNVSIPSRSRLESQYYDKEERPDPDSLLLSSKQPYDVTSRKDILDDNQDQKIIQDDGTLDKQTTYCQCASVTCHITTSQRCTLNELQQQQQQHQPQNNSNSASRPPIKASPSKADAVEGPQEINEDIYSAMHPLHQLSDIALKQLEAVTDSTSYAVLQEESKPRSSCSENPSRTVLDVESNKVDKRKSPNGALHNVGEKSESEKSKLKQQQQQQPKKANLRKGKWTAEEEEYTMRIIQHFRTGLLSLPDGHTLRSYLAEKLNCDPMRITKKFSGASCLGKRVYNLCDRSQISAHDLELAMAELDDLENRFKLRIEHGSSLPFPSRFSDRLRNARYELDQANFMMGNNYLFADNHKQNRGSDRALEHDNFQPSQHSNIFESLSNADASIQLALLQNFVTNQNHLGLSMALGGNYPQNDSYQNQYQLPNHAQSPRFANGRSANIFEAQQQQQQQQQHQSLLRSNLLSTLFNSQSANLNGMIQMNDQVQQLSVQLQSEALQLLAASGNASFQSPLTSSSSSCTFDKSNHGSSLSDSSATKALAARYKSAAQQQQSYQVQDDQEHHKIVHAPALQKGEKGGIAKSMNGNHDSKKVRTQQEQADGRMLLGFLQELQNNHLKATMSLSNDAAQGSISSVPQLQSTNASSDGTSCSGHSKRDNILRKVYDISVKKDSDMETASSLSGFNSSEVPKNEALSGSSGGSSGGESSDDNKGGSSGDDAERSIRTGPPRKRFRHEKSSSMVCAEDDELED